MGYLKESFVISFVKFFLTQKISLTTHRLLSAEPNNMYI